MHVCALLDEFPPTFTQTERESPLCVISSSSSSFFFFCCCCSNCQNALWQEQHNTQTHARFCIIMDVSITRNPSLAHILETLHSIYTVRISYVCVYLSEEDGYILFIYMLYNIVRTIWRWLWLFSDGSRGLPYCPNPVAPLLFLHNSVTGDITQGIIHLCTVCSSRSCIDCNMKCREEHTPLLPSLCEL